MLNYFIFLQFLRFVSFAAAGKEPYYYCTVSVHTDEFAYKLLEDDINEELNVPLHGFAGKAKLFRDALQENVFKSITKTYKDNGVNVAFVAGELKMVDCASHNVTQPLICSPSYCGAISELRVEVSQWWREQRPCVLLYISGHPLRDGTGRNMQGSGYTADDSGHYGMCAASTEDQIKDYGHGSLIIVSAVDADDKSSGIDMDHLTVELRKPLNRAMGCDSDSVAKCSSTMRAKLQSLAATNDGCLATEDPTSKLDEDFKSTLNLRSNQGRMREFSERTGRTDGVYISRGDLFGGPTEVKFHPDDDSEEPIHAEL